MKKQIVRWGLFLITGFAVFFLSWAGYYHKQQNKLPGVQEQTFPIIELTGLNGDIHSTKVLMDSAIFKVLVLFNPECDHCLHEFNDISAQIEKFHQSAVLFISPNPLRDLSHFAFKRKHPSNHKLIYNIDYEVLFKHFKCRGFPETYIYDKAGILIKCFRGRTDSKTILSFITV